MEDFSGFEIISQMKMSSKTFYIYITSIKLAMMVHSRAVKFIFGFTLATGNKFLRIFTFKRYNFFAVMIFVTWIRITEILIAT